MALQQCMRTGGVVGAPVADNHLKPDLGRVRLARSRRSETLTGTLWQSPGIIPIRWPDCKGGSVAVAGFIFTELSQEYTPRGVRAGQSETPYFLNFMKAERWTSSTPCLLQRSSPAGPGLY
jgi:hypothetical protein